jgi:carbon monoxide dehydrogenase subunit G
MKLFKVFLSFFVIIGLFLGISLFFPHQYKFENSIEINKPKQEVFTFMNNLQNWEQWSVWNKSIDSTMYLFYTTRKDSIGAMQYFNGNLLGSGRFKISNIKANEFLSYNLQMHQSEVNANGTFFFSDKNTVTQLTWVDSGDVGHNPIFRYMIPFKRSSTEKAFEEGLKRIKEVIEK